MPVSVVETADKVVFPVVFASTVCTANVLPSVSTSTCCMTDTVAVTCVGVTSIEEFDACAAVAAVATAASCRLCNI